jgi:hypothetical protein
VLSALASLLRLASIVLCLIVIASSALFVIDQTGSASAHQQAEVNNAAPGGAAPAPTKKTNKSAARKTLDEISEKVTSPFAFATESTHSEWLSHGIDLVLTLLVYGFGLAFVARVIRVRL